jgi:hypothetical protein
MPRRYVKPYLVHHHLQALDLGATATSVTFQMDGLVVGPSGTVNVPAPRPMRLVGIAVHAASGVVNTPGDWTLRVRVNESGTDSATFTFSMDALPGNKKAGPPSTVFTLPTAGTYHIVADGPSRNIVAIRVTLEWELLL